MVRGGKIADVWVSEVLPYPTDKWKNLIRKEVSKQVKGQLDKRLEFVW